MTLDELKQAADTFCQKHWGVPYTGEIKLVSRDWKWKNGHFETKRSDPSYQVIVFSKRKNSRRTKEEILGTLLHELVHWRLHVLGVPNHDTDQEFVEEAIRIGAPISNNKAAQEAYKKFCYPTGQMNIYEMEYSCIWTSPKDLGDE